MCGDGACGLITDSGRIQTSRATGAQLNYYSVSLFFKENAKSL